ncbi:NAD-dependent epimerase/dehydratase family protein [Aeromonas hydrophila]
MKSKQVIVTGATGFIGQHLIPSLIEQGYSVVAISRNVKKGHQFDWFEKVQFVSMDYHEDDFNFTPEEGSSLIHLAWQGLSNYMSLSHFEEDLPKSYNFIKRCISLGVKNVLITGTCYEYGMQHGQLSSSTKTAPVTPYGLAKDCLRLFLENLKLEHPFTLQWARLFYIYGHGQNNNSIITQLDAAIERNDPIFYMSGGEQLRDYLPVDVAIMQIIEIFSSDQNGIFNICSGQPISIRRLVEKRILEKESNISISLGHFPYRSYEPMAFWGTKE